MDILIVAPDFPFPPNHGGRADVWKRLLLLRDQGHVIDLLCTAEQGRVPSADLSSVGEVVRSMFFSPRDYGWRCLLSLKPFQVASRAGLRDFEPSAHYDAVLLETEFVAEVMPALGQTHAQKLLRVHNNEEMYFRAMLLASRGIGRRLYYWSEALKFRRYSPLVKRASDLVLHISHDEYEGDRRGEFRDKTIFFPPHVDASQFVAPRAQGGMQVLFVGNLFTDNNIAGLKWYLDEVHPLVRTRVSGYHLVIAGNSRGNPPGFLQTLDHDIRFCESPASLEEIYASSSLFINPVRSGAGVKIKTINAIEQGVPVVSTSVGAEGIGLTHGEHFLRADTPADFAHAVVMALADDALRIKLASHAQAYLAARFDNSARLGQILGKARGAA